MLLGLYQMGGYRRANRWLNLIHRPIDPRRIAMALIGGAAVAAFVAIVLPMVLAIFVQDAFSARVVDLRHWLLPVAAFLIAFAAYLAGAYAMIGVRRYAPFVLILPVLLAFSNAAGIGALAVQALVAAWLFYLLVSAFKPDLTQIPSRPVELVATLLPVQMAIYLVLLTAGGLIFQLGWIMVGTHPLNSTPRRGGFVEASRAEGPDLILAGLAGRDDAQARLWREQARISDTFRIQAAFDRLPVRGELTDSVPVEFDDAERGTRWTFSHDSMRFEGRSVAGGTRRGALGLGEGGERFRRPPVSLGDGTMVDAGTVARFDPEAGRILVRMRMPAGETIASAPVPVGESVALLTDKALYVYDAQALERGDREFPARQRVPLAGAIGNLERIDLIEQLDGYLVSETFGRGNPDGEGDAWQQMISVNGAGRAVPVARRVLTSDYPALSRFRDRWLSPVLSVAYRRAVDLFAPRSPLEASVPSVVPRSVWGLAALLAFLSLACAWWWAGKARLGRTRRIGWTAAAGLIGLPALISLFLFHPLRSRTA
jgi:hypothetical protein